MRKLLVKKDGTDPEDNNDTEDEGNGKGRQGQQPPRGTKRRPAKGKEETLASKREKRENAEKRFQKAVEAMTQPGYTNSDEIIFWLKHVEA